MGFGLKSVIGGAALGPAGFILGSRSGSQNKDLLLGKKDPGVDSRFLDLDPSLQAVVDEGRAGQLDILKNIRDWQKKRWETTDSGAIARDMAQRQMTELRGETGDRQRGLMQAIARQGMQGSAAGLTAQSNIQRDISRRMGEIRANIPLLQRQAEAQKLADIQGASQGINQILGTPGAQRTFMQGRESMGRQGGLLGLGLMAGGAALGAKFGGPQGAMSGMQMGSGFGQALQNF